ncbi:MAG: hypothetical protein EAY81_05765 [Bacteroidetes bacterium]|nr:MAG: hypothetical protein EAY81_05765 [Bacteroidota bacterium]
MKTGDEKFDDFLRSKMAEESFAFNEAQWQKASSMLDDARSKKKRMLFWITASILFTLVLSAVIFYPSMKQTPATTITMATQHTAEPVLQPQKLQGRTTPIKQVSKQKPLAQLPIAVTPASSNQKKPMDVKLKQVTPTPSHGKPNQPTESSSSASTNRAANNQLQPPLSTNVPLLNAAENTAELTTVPTAQDENSPHSLPDLTTENLKRVQLSTLWAAALFEQTPKLTLGNHQVMQPSFKQPSTIAIKPNLFVEGGLTWFNTATLNTPSLGAHLGLTYAFPLQGRFSMGVGLGYTQLNQTNGTRYYSTTSYGFAEQKKITGIKTVRLDYVELPLVVHYAISPKQGLFAGGSMLYIINSIDYKKNPEDITFDQKTSRYYQAYRPFDVQALFGYQYWVKSNIKISASYHYGLLDITDNAAFKRNDYNANKGFRIAVGYQLY